MELNLMYVHKFKYLLRPEIFLIFEEKRKQNLKLSN